MKQESMDDPIPEQEQEVAQCPECLSGIMHLRYLTYFTWLNNELITVQNFPAWVCDLCGRRDYDSRAINWLNMILNPEAGRRKPRKRPLPIEQKPSQKNKPVFPE
ncbi:MAG: YgiT-type zinc finger protein [Anaerolineales bacterium]